MKRISEAQAQLILEVSAEARSNYPPAALEKDLHLTAILYSIKNSNFHDMELVFGGGTSLVKACQFNSAKTYPPAESTGGYG